MSFGHFVLFRGKSGYKAQARPLVIKNNVEHEWRVVECSSNWIDQIYPVYLSCHIFSVLLFTQAFVSGGLPHRDGSVHLGVDYFARSADVCFNQVGHHHYSPTSSASSSLFTTIIIIIISIIITIRQPHQTRHGGKLGTSRIFK